MREEETTAPRVAGEARLAVEGGFAALPGRSRERVVSLDALPADEACTIACLAERADFFGCAVGAAPVRPDARTYRLSLTLGGRSRALRLAEPVRDPALADLLAAVRRACRDTPWD